MPLALAQARATGPLCTSLCPARIQLGHLGKKVGLVLVDEVPHMQTVHLDVLALEGGSALGHPGVVRVALSGGAILRDEATETDARLPVEQRQHSREHLAADVLKIRIDTSGAGGPEVLCQGRRSCARHTRQNLTHR